MQRPWLAAAGLYVIFIGVHAIAFAVHHAAPHNTSLLIPLEVVPYAVVLAIVVTARSTGALAFPVGSIRTPLRRWWLWVILSAIAIAAEIVQRSYAGPWSVAREAAVFAAVIEAPLAEEATFRGAIQTALGRTVLGLHSFLGLRASTLVAALAFSSIHFLLFFGNVPPERIAWEVASAFAIGLIIGYIYQRTANIWYGVLLHALGNLAGA